MFGIPYRQAQMRKPIENAIHTFAVPAVADLGSRFRSRAGFLDQCLVSSSTMASVGSGS